MTSAADDYLEKALKAEERAGATSDPDMRARWLGIAFGYRELSRYHNSLVESGLVELAAGKSGKRKTPRDVWSQSRKALQAEHRRAGGSNSR